MTLPETMRAVAIDKPGGPEVLVNVDEPVPVPGDNDVLVKVATAAITITAPIEPEDEAAVAVMYPMKKPMTIEAMAEVELVKVMGVADVLEIVEVNTTIIPTLRMLTKLFIKTKRRKVIELTALKRKEK